MADLLWTGNDWNFDAIQRVYAACENIAVNDLKLNCYPNQLEVINSTQMLDAYTSVGMPIYYKHWSFGKQFVREQKSYQSGRSGLAYELVINSNPCINYLMEDNTMTTQALVIAHAAFGHNHFFKNNYLFKQWTDAEGIVDYLGFAKNDLMDFNPRSSSRAFATPRSWSFVSQFLYDEDATDAELTDLISGTIGDGLAVKFMAHRKVAGQMPNPVDILTGKVKELKVKEVSAIDRKSTRLNSSH